MIHDVPVIGIDTWDFAYHGHQSERIVRMTDPEAAVDAAIEMAKRAAGRHRMGADAIKGVRAREVLDSRGNPTLASRRDARGWRCWHREGAFGRIDRYLRGARAARR